MSNPSIFITGIGTEVGKTVAAAIAVTALKADYWKPVQSGASLDSDSDMLRKLCFNTVGTIYPESYRLQAALSPHAAAEFENELIDIQKIRRPVTSNILVIEGAGGILVPLNHKQTIADLMHQEDFVILVCKHYLGSINHTLLSYNYLKSAGFQKIAIWFVGATNPQSEEVIRKMAAAFYLQAIPYIQEISEKSIQEEAMRISESLSAFLNWNKM